MSRTKISYLRSQIEVIGRELKREGDRRCDVEEQLCHANDAGRVSGEKHQITKQVVAAQAETIAALRELIEMYKLRCSVRQGVDIETDTGNDQARIVGGRFFPPGIGASEPHPDERHLRYSVKLLSHGANKIKVIKAIRFIFPNIMLKAAKDLSEEEGAVIVSGDLKRCNEVAEWLQDIGAVVEVVKS